MNLISRVEKLEYLLDQLNIGTNKPPGIIAYKRDSTGNELYRIDREGEQAWVNREDLDIYLAQFEDSKTQSPIIFLPIKGMEI